MVTAHHRTAAVAAVILAGVGLLAGYRLLGTPQHQREISADERRVADLQGIQRLLYARQKYVLPAELPPSLGAGGEVSLRDPQTNQPYEYQRGAGSLYRLCATFKFASSEGDVRGPGWEHPAGRYCYELDATDYR